MFRSAMLILVAASTAVAEPTRVEVGGPRAVRAEIDTADGQHIVIVWMRPVRVFDAPTNAEINREKARLYALQALAKHLGGAELTLSGASIDKAGPDGNEYRLTLRVPADKVRVAATTTENAAPAADEVRVRAPKLFTAGAEHRQTIHALADAVRQSLRAAVAEKEREQFLESVAAIESAIKDSSKLLRREIEADRLLFDTDDRSGTSRPELLAELTAVRSRILDELTAAVAARKDDCADPKFTAVEIAEPFAAILGADPLLMEVTGAKVVHLADGGRCVIAVASTVVKDASAADRLRAERVCRDKAIAGFLAETRGVQVVHVEKLREEVTVRVEKGREKVTTVAEVLSMTRAEVEGIAKDMPPVGTWKSADGKVFYLAIGRVIEAKK